MLKKFEGGKDVREMGNPKFTKINTKIFNDIKG